MSLKIKQFETAEERSGIMKFEKGRLSDYLEKKIPQVRGHVEWVSKDLLTQMIRDNVEFLGEGDREEHDSIAARKNFLRISQDGVASWRNLAERLLLLKAFQLYQTQQGSPPYLPREVVETGGWDWRETYEEIKKELVQCINVHDLIDRAVQDTFWDFDFSRLALYGFIWTRFYLRLDLNSKLYGCRKFY